jgi:hypothetical protein
MNDTATNSISVIKQYLEQGKKIPIGLKDDLLFGALLNIYEVQERQGRSISGMRPWVGLVRWGATILGAAIILLLLSMLTHTFTWPF